MAIPLMTEEARSAPERVAALLAAEGGRYREAAERLRSAAPPFAVTVGRGSSDHAGLYARYLLETALGLVTASAAPSVVTAYGAELRLAGAFVLGLSQSGASPDLVRFVDYARAAGGITLALLNQTDSPLGRAAETTLPIHAGEERAVAATKSFICTGAAAAMLAGAWARDPSLLAALERLPDQLGAALQPDWSAGIEALAPARRLLVVARGRGFAIAAEMALKLKEVAGLQAEAFSAAEVLHGPLAVLGADQPVLALAIEDETLPSLLSTLDRMRQAGARPVVISSAPQGAEHGLALRFPGSGHPALDPLVAVQAFYPFAAALALARGQDPDNPPHLAKVTRTL